MDIDHHGVNFPHMVLMKMSGKSVPFSEAYCSLFNVSWLLKSQQSQATHSPSLTSSHQLSTAGTKFLKQYTIGSVVIYGCSRCFYTFSVIFLQSKQISSQYLIYKKNYFDNRLLHIFWSSVSDPAPDLISFFAIYCMMRFGFIPWINRQVEYVLDSIINIFYHFLMVFRLSCKLTN